MKKISCCLLAGLLLLAPTLPGHADINPRTISIKGGFHFGTTYFTNFGNESFTTNSCDSGDFSMGRTSYLPRRF